MMKIYNGVHKTDIEKFSADAAEKLPEETLNLICDLMAATHCKVVYDQDGGKLEASAYQRAGDLNGQVKARCGLMITMP